MSYQRIAFSLLTIVTVISTPVISSLEMPLGGLTAWGQTSDNRKVEADRLFKEGIRKSGNGKINEAIQDWQKALNIYQQTGDKLKRVKVLSELGLAYFSQGKYQNAKEYHQQSLAIARDIGYKEGEATSLNNLGNAYCFSKECQKGIKLHQQALLVARQIGLREQEVKSFNGLGNAYRRLKDNEKAIQFYQQSLTIAKKIGYKEGEAKALTNLGGVYSSQKQYEKAIEFLEQSLAIVKQGKDRRTEAVILDNLGHIYTLLGRFNKALESSQQSLNIYKSLGNKQGELRQLTSLGIIFRNIRQYQKAIEFHQQSLAIAKELGNRHSEAMSYGNLGVANYFIGKYNKAIEFHEGALTIYKELSFKAGIGLTLGNLGLAYSSLGDTQKAIKFYQQSLVIARELNDKLREGNALNNIGSAYINLGQYTNASATLLEAIDVYESIRLSGLSDANKISIFDTYSRSYPLLQQAFIADNKPFKALEIAERGRARAFVELLDSKLSQNPNSQSIIKTPKIEDIRKVAKEQNATIVQYSIIISEIYIWVIKPTGEITFRKADLKPLWQKENTTLAELVSNSRTQIGVRSRAAGGLISSYNPKKAKNRFKQLHSLLIKPIADILPKNPDERVIFVPQSSLFLVPFPALQDAEGKYLIEKHTILTAPSIQVLDLTRKQRNRVSQIHQKTAKQDILIVGNPTMPSVSPEIGKPPKQLPSLPGAEMEAKAIAKLFNTKPLIGKDATETIVRQRFSEAKIIHLATHGLLDDFKDGSVPGAIALAPDPPSSPLTKGGNEDGNGLLTANEIFDLQINADLVVLSACDTGQGKLTGDGVIGLSRSLISAGAPSVIVTLWTIPDNPTAMLMTEFYRQLQQNPDKAKALRQAMLKTMEKHKNPRDWAAFTLIGEAE
ncbi:MAG: CHAT domain-containing tetratricopeptide repeat protein [Rivularia sp. (in: cyanobacteria)]